MAIIKPNNNTLSAITSLPAAITTGSLIKLSTQTASSDASIVFDLSSLDSSREFSNYQLYTNLIMTTSNTNFDVQIGTDTSNWITSAYNFGFNYNTVGVNNGNSNGNNGSSIVPYGANDSGSNPIRIISFLGNMNTASSMPYAKSVRIYNDNSSGAARFDNGAHAYYTSGDYRALRLNATSSTIASGTTTLYGVKA